ncbi:MAG TPA: TMEM175 family protein [Hyphomicrobium sp.]|nr:TMEM175 family protein [Hyphomicrobium sp.]
MGADGHTRETFGSERLVAFTDGVMAVAITLLVLDLKLPEGVREETLSAALVSLSHALWCYALSFAVIGILWMVHHNQFAHIARVDGVILWLNLLFLMTVALIPFVTSVLSDQGGALSTMLYAAVLMASCAIIAVMWWYAGRTAGLMAPDVAIEQRRLGIIAPLLVAGVFAASIGVAYTLGGAAGQWTWLLAAVSGPVADRLSRL